MIGRMMIAALAAQLAFGCASSKPQSTSPSKATAPLVERPTDEGPASTVAPFECDETAADWPMFQRDMTRSGASAAPSIASPKIAWSMPIGIAGWLNNPVIAGGRVYAPSSGQIWNAPDGADGVYAFDLRSGEQLWFAPTPGDANAVAYSKCRVFVGSDAGTVTALNAQTGDVLWSQELGGKVYANPLPIDGVVVVAGSLGDAPEGRPAAGFVGALDVVTGKLAWRHELSGAARGGAAADDDRVYITTETAEVIALSRGDGARVWSSTVDGPGVKSVYAAPTVFAGRLYVSFVRDTSYDVPAVRSYDAATGAAGWVGQNTQQLAGGWGNVRSSPAFSDGQLYWGEPYSNRIVALDANSGDITTSVAAGMCTFPHWPSPAVAQEVVYVPRHDGGLYAYDAEAGALRWSLYLGEANHVSQAFPPEHLERSGARCDWDPPFGKPVYASPAVATDGTVIVATGDGWLHAVRDSTE